MEKPKNPESGQKIQATHTDGEDEEHTAKSASSSSNFEFTLTSDPTNPPKSLTPEEIFDQETYSGLEDLDEDIEPTPDLVDIDYGDESEANAYARSFSNVRSMLTELSCRVGKCVHTRKYSKALSGYGCNCYTKDKANTSKKDSLWFFNSRGRPLDAVDQACRLAYRTYKCFDIDVRNSEITDKEVCKQGIKFKFHMKDGKIICGPVGNPEYKNKPNLNSCKLAACEIERDFSYWGLTGKISLDRLRIRDQRQTKV